MMRIDIPHSCQIIINSGSFATVVEATDLDDNGTYAMKIIDKNKVKGSNQSLKSHVQHDVVGKEAHIINEVNLLRKIQHKNIVRLHNVFETKDKIFMQMELVSGGELFDRIATKGVYTENDAKKIIRNILESLQYLHERDIVLTITQHRDLKPENLLLSDPSDDAEVKLADFGLSRLVDGGKLLNTCCGTLTYVAPEVLMGTSYEGKGVDMWATGVITYILLSGYPPFFSGDDNQILEMTLQGIFYFPSPDWDPVSEQAKDFIRNLIVLDPQLRMTADRALIHPWMLEGQTKGTHIGQVNIHRSVMDNLNKHFNARAKLKGAFEAITFLRKLQLHDGMRLETHQESVSPNSPIRKPSSSVKKEYNESAVAPNTSDKTIVWPK